MTIPSSITTALDSLESQVAAAQPLANASEATRTALKLNASSLVTSIRTTLAASSALDTWTAPADPNVIISGVLGLVDDAADQSNLALMGGVVGRAAANLNQLP